MNIRQVKRSLVICGAAVCAPAWAVSLSAVSPAQDLPLGTPVQATLTAASNPTPGSATLAPLMAAEYQAHEFSTADSPQTAAGGATKTGTAVDDVSFVARATESGRKEVNTARNAIPQLKDPDLKRIAEMLVADHSRANEKLAKIAESKGLPVPGPKAPEPPAPGTATTDFDAKFLAEQIAGHERSIALYSAQAQSGEDEDLRKFARETLPRIQHHLEELKQVRK